MVYTNTVQGVEIKGPLKERYEVVLSPNAVAFLGHLARQFTGRVEDLLQRRVEQQKRFDAGQQPHFLPETKHVREGNWKCNPTPSDMLDRRVEITGPSDRKMVINALNSGASTYMCDMEDSNCPTWDNMVQGQVNLYDAVRGTIEFSDPAMHIKHSVCCAQVNLYDAVRGTIEFSDPASGKKYALKGRGATLILRPRGWHLWEKHVVVDGKPVPGAIFDFALYFFNNAKALLDKGSGPYYYLPKMQSHLECRLWNDIFVESQCMLGIPQGTIKATCLIETLPAAFEMDEFLYELREHSSGLNCGRWDYIFSFIKTQRENPNAIIPDRGCVTMENPFMRAYTQLVIKTCHKRGVHAMGGMAAQIPIKNDAAANQAVMDKVRADKLREVKDGHDGTWVAHPGLIPIAKEVFDAHMPVPNQIHRQRDDVNVAEADLLSIPAGPKTVATLHNNISVGIQYIAAWLSGNGCVPLHNLMEDAATAEISRTQIWQWIRHGVALDDGQVLTVERLGKAIDQEMELIKKQVGPAKFHGGKYLEAAHLFKYMATTKQLEDFLTLPAYEILIAQEYGPATSISRLATDDDDHVPSKLLAEVVNISKDERGDVPVLVP